jgi:hypothetical protein
MKHIPILFSTKMVQAILEGRKTQTRRVIKTLAWDEGFNFYKFHAPKETQADFAFCHDPSKSKMLLSQCPYGHPGDVLWVRETWQTWALGYLYKATYGDLPDDINWRPSIHMPKTACRIWLRITEVRVERLHDITRGDAMDEGCPFPNMATGTNPRDWFKDLWQSINGPECWEANPWVWVIDFERCLMPAFFSTK